MGVPAGMEMLGTTQPYYRSTYVFVSRRTRHLKLAMPVDVQIVYRVAEVRDDRLEIHKDVYGLEARPLADLAAAHGKMLRQLPLRRGTSGFGVRTGEQVSGQFGEQVLVFHCRALCA